jgi:hypothetical protein
MRRPPGRSRRQTPGFPNADPLRDIGPITLPCEHPGSGFAYDLGTVTGELTVSEEHAL